MKKERGDNEGMKKRPGTDSKPSGTFVPVYAFEGLGISDHIYVR